LIIVRGQALLWINDEAGLLMTARKRWLVQRGIEIISEASRHLSDELKARHPEIPWPKVAGIGNVLRHDYEHVAHDVLWRVVRDDLPPLERICREELARVQPRQ
jgi:uncharacterized protein with HEPN domain